jgi:hypothetical protein
MSGGATLRGVLRSTHSIIVSQNIYDYKAKKLLISSTEIKSFYLRYALYEPHDL